MGNGLPAIQALAGLSWGALRQNGTLHSASRDCAGLWTGSHVSNLQLTVEVTRLRQLEQLHVCCPDLRQLCAVAHNGLLPQGHPKHILHQQGGASVPDADDCGR